MKKLISYLGFAQKSNNCVMGQTALRKSLKQFYLIMVCNTASENLKNLAKNLANKHGCEYVISNFELKTLLNKDDIKIVGITDLNLSKAIVNHFANIDNSN